MDIQSLDWWACPDDGHFPLITRNLDKHGNRIISGELICEKCSKIYSIQDEIPNFVLLEGGENGEIKRAEIDARSQELEWPTNKRQLYKLGLEASAVNKRLRTVPGDTILDAGCGYGWITQKILERGPNMFAVDFARPRLELFRSKTTGNRLELAAADINHLPFRPQKFNKIISTQVLEHLPTWELRRAFVSRLYELLVPGGSLVLTVYNYDIGRQKSSFEKEGYHESGIFYHCYTADELATDLSDFEIMEICGIQHHLPGEYKTQLFSRLSRIGLLIDHAIEKIPRVSLKYGHLLLAHARKPDA